MKKTTMDLDESKTVHPNQGPYHANGQRPQTKTRGQIQRQTTDNFNNNSGPRQRSRKKSF